MATLDLKKLREKNKDLQTGGGDDKWVYSGKLGEADEFRILPPTEELNGIYYMEQEGHWIDGKYYQSNSTFGGEDVIEEEIEIAKKSNDPDILALIEAKKNGNPLVKSELRYLVPVLALEVVYEGGDPDGDIEAIKVKDNKAKILVAKRSLLLEINKVVTAAKYQNGTDCGVLDLVKGRNFTLSKTGKGLDTEYSSVVWPNPTEMDAKWAESINLYQEVKKLQKSDRYLRSVIRNYLYGEPILEDAKETQEETKAGKIPNPKAGAAKKEETPKRSLLEDTEDNIDNLK